MRYKIVKLRCSLIKLLRFYFLLYRVERISRRIQMTCGIPWRWIEKVEGICISGLINFSLIQKRSTIQIILKKTYILINNMKILKIRYIHNFRDATPTTIKKNKTVKFTNIASKTHKFSCKTPGINTFSIMKNIPMLSLKFWNAMSKSETPLNSRHQIPIVKWTIAKWTLCALTKLRLEIGDLKRSWW